MLKKQAEIIKYLNDKEILFHLYATQIIILALSGAIGLFLFEELSIFLQLWDFFDLNILFVGGGTAIAVIAIDLLLMKWLPKEMFSDGGINDLVFQKRSSIHIFFLCILISFAEELLFRGVLQTHYGVVAASLIFAILHIRYLYKWVLLISVIGLSFLLGFIYEWTGNLFVTVFAHFLIDFVFALKIRMDYVKRSRKVKLS